MSFINDAVSKQDEVTAIINEYVDVYETLNVNLSYIGLNSEDMKEGKTLMQEAQNLIAQTAILSDPDAILLLLDEAVSKQKDAIKKLPEINVHKTTSKTYKITGINEIIGAAISDELKSKLNDKNYVDTVVSQDLVVYNITNKDRSSRQVVTSQIKVRYTAGKTVEGAQIIVSIPKTIANSTSELMFNVQPIVLQDDPIVMWEVGKLTSGQTAQYFYTLEKQVDSLDEFSAVLSGEEIVPEPRDVIDNEVTGDIIKDNADVDLLDNKNNDSSRRNVLVLLIIVLVLGTFIGLGTFIMNEMRKKK